MIFGISNEYQDVCIDLGELKSDFRGCLCEEKIDYMRVRAGKQTWNRGLFGKKTGNACPMNNYDFWWSIV